MFIYYFWKMEQRKYIWRKFENVNYINIDERIRCYEYDVTTRIELSTELNHLTSPFNKSFSLAVIPIEMDSLLEELLREFNLLIYKPQFLIIGFSLQKIYSDNFNIQKDNLSSDFENENEDYLKLLDILREYLFAQDKNHLHSISFKYNTGITQPIKNFFAVDTIYEAMCIGLDINKENFDERKIDLLSKCNNYKVEKYPEKIKTEFIQAIYNYIKPSFDTDNTSLRFIGCFLNIFQVPSNNKEHEINNNQSIAEMLSSLALTNLRHYINRPPSYLL